MTICPCARLRRGYSLETSRGDAATRTYDLHLGPLQQHLGFYCLEPKEGTLEELVTLALSAEVGGANMACRPRLNEPEIKANVRHFEDPDETCRPLSRLCDVLREDAANTQTLQK